MLKKSHALALTVATAGLIGLSTTMASAATIDHGHGSVVDFSHNQAPIQACGNDVNGNALGGQVPAEGDALVASLLSPGSYTKSSGISNRNCGLVNNQSDTKAVDGARSAVVKVVGNQIPTQVCGNNVLVNGGGGQVPLYGISGAISALSPLAITHSVAVSNRGCGLTNNQSNSSNQLP